MTHYFPLPTDPAAHLGSGPSVPSPSSLSLPVACVDAVKLEMRRDPGKNVTELIATVRCEIPDNWLESAGAAVIKNVSMSSFRHAIEQGAASALDRYFRHAMLAPPPEPPQHDPDIYGSPIKQFVLGPKPVFLDPIPPSHVYAGYQEYGTLKGLPWDDPAADPMKDIAYYQTMLAAGAMKFSEAAKDLAAKTTLTKSALETLIANINGLSSGDSSLDGMSEGGDSVLRTIKAACPQADAVDAVCPVKDCGHPDTVLGLVPHINDSHGWSFDKIAHWVDRFDLKIGSPLGKEGVA